MGLLIKLLGGTEGILFALTFSVQLGVLPYENLLSAVSAIFFIVTALGCSGSGHLSNEAAARAIVKWSGDPPAVLEIKGVLEIPQQNIAKVDIQFSDFHYNKRDAFFGGTKPRDYAGPGVAIFTHYNDGRWVLTHLETSEGFGSSQFDMNVEAK